MEKWGFLFGTQIARVPQSNGLRDPRCGKQEKSKFSWRAGSWSASERSVRGRAGLGGSRRNRRGGHHTNAQRKGQQKGKCPVQSSLLHGFVLLFRFVSRGGYIDKAVVFLYHFCVKAHGFTQKSVCCITISILPRCRMF